MTVHCTIHGVEELYYCWNEDRKEDSEAQLLYTCTCNREPDVMICSTYKLLQDLLECHCPVSTQLFVKKINGLSCRVCEADTR